MSTSMFSNYEDNLVVKTALSCCNVLVHLLMGMTVAVPLLFAVVKDFDTTAAPEDIIMLHILLCVPGYQLIMSQSLLSQSYFNTWTSGLNKTNKRRVHWILQLLGSGMAIAGSFIIMIYKDINFDTIHGKLGLTALVFTTVNLVTGVAALFAHPLNKYIPSYVSKLTHIVFGIVAFTCASSCLCYGFNKDSFRNWTNDAVATGVIAITGIFTLIIVINPLVTLVKKVIHLIKMVRNK